MPLTRRHKENDRLVLEPQMIKVCEIGQFWQIFKKMTQMNYPLCTVFALPYVRHRLIAKEPHFIHK